VFGGWNGRRTFNTLNVFDLNKEEWENVTIQGDTPPVRNNHATCTLNESIYIHGGHDGENWLDDFYILDTKKLLCKKLPQNSNQYVPKARACHTLNRIGRKIYLYGGYDGKDSFRQMEIFDIETHMWSIITQNKSKTLNYQNIQSNNSQILPVARNAHSATVIGKKIYIFGGYFQSTHLKEMIIFDSIKLEWSFPKLMGNLPQNGI
jgi:N-acetylneuraminic acid mutarotase